MPDAPLPTEPPMPQIDQDNPWPGLASFGERDEAYFKGRDAEIGGLLRTVQAQRVSVLFGASGLGKTSLLRAGLGPRLSADNELVVHMRLDFGCAPMPLFEQVYEEIARAAVLHRIEVPQRLADEPLWNYLHRRDAAFWNARNRLVLPVLVFDQFEEVFSRGLDSAAWTPFVRDFLAQLADLAEGRPPSALMARIERDADAAAAYDFTRHRYRLVISLREDYLAPLEELRKQMPSIGSGRYRLQPMTGRQALLVADQTHGRLVETPVAEQIVRIAAGRAFDDADPPGLDELRVDTSLLGLFCRELNLRRQAQGASKISDALVRDGQGNIIEAFYEDCMRKVDPALRQFVEDELVTANGHRDSRAVEDALLRPGVTREHIAALVDARLLRVEDRAGVHRTELSHDVLTRVVRKSRDARRTQERVETQQAAEREQLRRGKDAADLELLKQRARAAELADERARIERARADEALAASRRSRVLALAVAVVAAIAVGLAALAYRERGRAQAESEQARGATKQAQLDAELARQALAASRSVADQTLQLLEKVTQAQQAAAGALNPAASNYDARAAALLAQAGRSVQSATQDAKQLQACPAGRRIYPHVGQEADKSVVQGLAPALREAGFIVPAVELVPRENVPNATAVRYFRRSEEAGAASALAALEQAGVRGATTVYVGGYENSTNLRPCHYELWVAIGGGRS